MTYFFLALFSSFLLSCSSSTSVTITETPDPPPVSGKPDYTLLFIGNSLTYSNNLPALVENVAKQKNIHIKTKLIAKGNYAIIDHWNDGVIQEEIKKGIYDFVIFQQGPSSQPYGREVLIDYGRRLTDLCQKNNAKLAYFMVWPSRNYYHTFDGVIKNHRDAAEINKSILLPVGEVWKAYFDSTNTFDYYIKDGFHPSLKGSQVAAEVIVKHLFKL